MEENVLKKIYNKIAQTVADTIQEEWSRVLLYGEITEGVRSVFFYYYTDKSSTPVHSHNIPELFDISEGDYNQLWRQLLDGLSELWREWKENGEAPWTNLTMVFTVEGEFRIEYDYEDLSEADDYERSIIWEHKNLGLIPEDEEDKRFLEEYLANVGAKGN